MKSKVLLISLVAVLALSLGLVACTQQVTPTPTTPTSINIAYPGGFDGLLSTVDPCNFLYGGPDNPNIFETLVGQNASEGLIPLLAESWSWSADGLTCTVNLLKNVVFSSGDPFTADDVLFSLDRYLQYPGPVIAQLTPEQGYKDAVKVDDHTVKFEFTKVNVQFVPQTLVFMGITSKLYYDRVGEDAYLANPVGTGPYKIDTWKEGEYIDVVYNDKYRGDKPQIESAHFVVYSNPETGVSMLKNGEVDLISPASGSSLLSPGLSSSITELENAGFRNIPVTQAHALALVFNLVGDGTPAWEDVRVRQAIDYAIDKDHIAGSMMCGLIQDGTWVLPSSPWYDPWYVDKGLDPSYTYDLTKAQQLMNNAGYAGGFDITIFYLATETITPLAEYLADALKALNINVTLDTPGENMGDFMPVLHTIHNLYYGGNATPTVPGAFLYYSGWPGNSDVAIDLTNGFYYGNDITLFDDANIFSLVDQVLSTLDDSTRYGLAADAWEAIDNLLPAIPIGIDVQTNFSIPTVVYIKSVGGMWQGPRQLVDLRIIE